MNKTDADALKSLQLIELLPERMAVQKSPPPRNNTHTLKEIHFGWMKGGWIEELYSTGNIREIVMPTTLQIIPHLNV